MNDSGEGVSYPVTFTIQARKISSRQEDEKLLSTQAKQSMKYYWVNKLSSLFAVQTAVSPAERGMLMVMTKQRSQLFTSVRKASKFTDNTITTIHNTMLTSPDMCLNLIL